MAGINLWPLISPSSKLRGEIAIDSQFETLMGIIQAPVDDVPCIAQ